MGIYQGSKLMSGGGGGPSPYEIAKQNGYTRTEQEFNQLLAALDQNATKQELNNKADLVDGKVPAEQVDAYTKTEANTLLQNKADTSSVYTKAESDTLLQKKADKDRVVNPNLLDNWYFGNPVDQRQGRVVKPNTTYYSDNTLATAAGTTSAYVTAYRYAAGTASGVNYASFKLEDSDTATTYYAAPENVVRGYTGAGYGIDRWYCAAGEMVTIGDGVITVKCVSASNRNFYQIIEKSRLIPGQIYTASWLVDDVFGTCTLRFGTIKSVGLLGTVVASSPDLYTITFTAPESDVDFVFGNAPSTVGDYISIHAAKLELGSQQTLAHQDENGNWVLNEIPDYGEQLARCQRYFIELNPNNVEYNTVAVGVGWSGGTEVDFVIPIPTTMRANPTIVNLSNFHCVDTTDISWHNFTSANCYLGSGFIKMVGFIDASVSGRTYALMCDKNSLKMHLSADL